MQPDAVSCRRQVPVNLSGTTLNDAAMREELFAMVRRRLDLVSKLCFEVTESVALRDTGDTREFLSRLRELGATVSLDDFGQGYTSWSYLQNLPADVLKIDGAIIRDVTSSRTSAVIVRSIVELTHGLGMTCVAEWVEDVTIIEHCAALGVDAGQGWGLAKPLPLADLLAVGGDLHRLVAWRPTPAADSSSGITESTTGKSGRQRLTPWKALQGSTARTSRSGASIR